MLDKQVTVSGKIFTKITNLKPWDKNPKELNTPEDLERLKRQITHLGQYKSLLVTDEGIVVGGNQRLKAMQALGYEDVWITELSFGQVEQTDPNQPTQFKALIDGKVQEGIFESIEQGMIEYALSDNDQVGMYNQQELADLVLPYKEVLPLGDYRLELAPPISLQTFVDERATAAQPPGLDEQAQKQEKDKKIVLKMEYTPDQFKEVEPTMQAAKSHLGVESLTDLFTSLLQQFHHDHVASPQPEGEAVSE